MENLYRKFKLRDGSKVYVPTVKGRHHLVICKTASAAQKHSERVRARYRRLKAVEPKAVSREQEAGHAA